MKLDTSNIRKWQPNYVNLEQSLLDYTDNYVAGRTELDMVYEIMLKYGLDLTYPAEEYTIDGKKIYAIGFGMLMICLADEITSEIAQGILDKVAELAPETPSGQIAFLYFLYNKEATVNATELSKLFDWTPMTSSRALNELYKANLLTYTIGGKTGRGKYYSRISDPDYFENGKELLNSPIKG